MCHKKATTMKRKACVAMSIVLSTILAFLTGKILMKKFTLAGLNKMFQLVDLHPTYHFDL